LKGYNNDLYINVKKYINNEFEDKPWMEPEQMDQVIDSVNELIPKLIPNEIMNQITKEVIENNEKNVKLFFDDDIKVNPDSKPQWNRNDNPLLPINPDTWEDIQEGQELDDVRKSLQDKLENEVIPMILDQIIPNSEELKDTKRNDDESTTPPKKVTFEEQITVKISDLEKPDTTPIENIPSKKIEIVTEEKISEHSVKRQSELNDHIAKQDMQLEELRNEISQLTLERNYNYGLYQHEWMICEQLAKDIQKLYEKNYNDTLSRRFIMKTQLQIIRRKDKELKEFAKRINQLQEDVNEYKLLTEQWQNPDLSQVFSPETVAIFENIVEQCETNSVKTNNDNNLDIEMSDQDIEMISNYLNFDVNAEELK